MSEELRAVELLKGSLFVALTAVLIFALMRRELVLQGRLRAELERERTRLVEAQAVAKVGSWETDVPTLHVSWSEETHRIFGTDPATFRPTHAGFLERVHPDDRQRVDDAFQASLSADGAHVIEHRVVDSGGNVKVVEERWRVFRDGRGRAVRALGTCRDVTAQREAARALRESQQMIASVIHAIPVRVFWKDVDLRYLGCNAAFAHDAGCAAPEEVVGKDDFQLAWREHAERYRADDRAVIDSGQPRLLIEEPLTTPGGKRLRLLTSKIPLVDSAGQIVGVLGTYVDVTELRRAEAEQIKLATAVEQAADAVIITDEKGDIEYVNPAFERLTGYSLAEARGRNPRFLKSGRHDDAFYSAMWETLLAGGVWRGRITSRCKDGTLVEEEATISPVRDASGRITHYVAVKHDVTKQVELQQQLLQAQKMEAVGRLAGGVAHDFNNLLCVILGYGEMAIGKLGRDHPATTLVEQVVAAGRRAESLTRQLLAFSRRQVLQPQLVDVGEAVRNLEKMLRRLLGEDIALEVEVEPHAVALADPGQLEQVVLNLLVNARDAMPRGGRLRLAVRAVDAPDGMELQGGPLAAGRYVLVEAADSGVGMDAETQARAFEPFFTTKPGHGTGLGLATVHGIVRQSGGSVGFESTPGVGTTFRVYVPRADGPPAAREAVDDALPPPGRGERILVVEDQQPVRDLVRTWLEAAGHRVVTAADGAEALEVAKGLDHAVDVLVTDVVMPRLAGPDLAKRLTSRWPDLRVVYMSGYTADVVAEHGVLAPGVRLVDKPLDRRVLLRTIRAALDEVPSQARGARLP